MVRHGARSYQHFYSYGAVMQRKGLQALCLRFINSAGQDAARALLFLQRFGPFQVAYAPCGCVGLEEDAPAVYDVLHRYARAKWLRALFMSPLEMPPPPGTPIMTGAAGAVLDLASSPDAIKAGMHQKWRNRLYKAQRSELDVVCVQPTHALAQWLMDEETKQRKDKRYKALEATLPASLAQAKGQTICHFCIAKFQGTPVAGASFIVNGPYATYFSGVTLGEGRDLCAQHLVLFEAVRRLGACGVHTLDLGLIDTHQSPGLARFKLGLGAQAQRQSGAFLFV